jgi:AraC-like DNA-binding protein
MRTTSGVVAGPGFEIAAVTCTDDHVGWSPAEAHGGHHVVLARRGRFRRLDDGVPVDVDETMGYVAVPGHEERFAHPAGGDVCTAVHVSPALWASLAGDRPVAAALYVDARLDLAHRSLLRAARGADHAYALAEDVLALLAEALAGAAVGPTPAAADRMAADRPLVAAARAAVADGHPAARGLMPLAEMLAASPYRLSRAFSRETGVSLTRYRNRVRVGRALDRIAAGDADGARLAAELGFADQAHLCRTVRDHTGHPPTALRALLGARGSNEFSTTRRTAA